MARKPKTGPFREAAAETAEIEAEYLEGRFATKTAAPSNSALVRKAVPAPPRGLEITVTQYQKAAGLRWERMAGFESYANRELGARHRLTVSEWQQLYDAWLARPAGKREV